MSEAAEKGRPIRVGPGTVFAIWTLYGLIGYSQWVVVRPPELRAPWKWYGPWVLWLGGAWAWAALTPVVVRLARSARPRLAAPLPLLAHIAAVAAIHGVLWHVNALAIFLISTERPAHLLAEYPRGLAQTLLLYVAVVLAVRMLDHARIAEERAAQATRLEADLARARLDTLRRQIQPHFLFNTLNTIAALIDSDPPRAGEMVARLGGLLRHSLEDYDRPLIPLAAELDFVRLYTAIERVRFESWLEVAEDVDPDVLEAWVPPMILQPLVENAIRHGVAPSGRKGTILITAAQTAEGRLRLEVIDDGAGLPVQGRLEEGVGLRATHARLAHLFADDARLALETHRARTHATLDLPLVRDVDRERNLVPAYRR